MVVKMEQIYFPEDESFLYSSSSDLVGITQSVIPIKGLRPIETLQTDLTKSEDDLWAEIKKSTRQHIRQAQKNYRLSYFATDEPTDEQIHQFRDYYNEFARAKKTRICTSFNVNTMKLLRNQKSLFMSFMETEDNKPICYRVYAVDGKRAMALYNASHYRMEVDTDRKKMLSNGHHLQKWMDILKFKEKGFLIVDSGGLTNDEKIRNYKLQFGGNIVTEYSGYLPKTVLGQLVIYARNRSVGV
ncbi:hypothetical protein [Bacillus sp. FJAT-27225]|uniref:hypothetical protein n=1 Tax=Bacillus sp. FJAT-27225 TaxID=1743144 RepID=UPI0011123D0E|nr:hypothetical protein [Bacillus sp. FJAT-27225]